MSRIPSRIDVPKLLELLGVVAKRQGKRWVASCPFPGHDETEPSWSIVDDPGQPKHGAHHCFGCKRGGGPWELAAARWGTDARTAGQRLRELGMGSRVAPRGAPRVKVHDARKPSILTLPDHVVIPGPGGEWFAPALRYLESRTVPVPRQQLDRWGCGYAIRGRLINRIVIPVYDARGRLLTYTARTILPKAKPRYKQAETAQGARPRRALWGEARWHGTDVACLAEGVFGAMAFERAGAPNATAVLGSSLTEERARVLDRFGHIVVGMDPDAAGRNVTEWIQVLGRRARISVLDLPAAPDDIPVPAIREALAAVIPNFEFEP